uniref:Uncharacterized protein n=1 Tax=Sparus aurata TaxID=8175 RepID=A0A671TM01_SPAAU
MSASRISGYDFQILKRRRPLNALNAARKFTLVKNPTDVMSVAKHSLITPRSRISVRNVARGLVLANTCSTAKGNKAKKQKRPFAARRVAKPFSQTRI